LRLDGWDHRLVVKSQRRTPDAAYDDEDRDADERQCAL
jgi:hypothetical protein